jgi:drug/metabolite transporter (DMT)-like permease
LTLPALLKKELSPVDSTNFLGGIAALISAVVWGTGDFVGGLASRDRNQYQILALSAFAGMVSLLIAMFIWSEPWPDPVSILWSCVAGISGAIGMASLYRGLATAKAVLVAPTAAVVSVIFPIIVGTIIRGTPGLEKWIGMAAGVAGIWFVTKASESSRDTNGLGLAILAGFGFGGFFLCIVQTNPEAVFSPLVIAKMTALIFAILILLSRRTRLPSFKGNGLALLAGVLDAAGNAFYLLAARLTRVELAAVVSSMAPVVTVILASFISRQKVSAYQKLGVAFCLIAIALILI